MAQTTPPPLTPTPTPAIQRGDRATFSSRLDAMVLWWINATTEWGNLGINVFNNAVDAFNSAVAAAASAVTAATHATNASNSATAAATTANAAAWVNGGTYALNDNAISQIDFLTYRKQTASSVTTIDPKNDPTNWVPLVLGSIVRRSARTSNAVLSVLDKGYLIDITSGTFTQTFTAAATLGDGWFCYVKNSGAGVITLDPNASETISGSATRTLRGGEWACIQSDGTNLNIAFESGGEVLLATITPSASSSIVLEDVYDDRFKTFRLELSKIVLSTASYPRLTLSTNNTYASATYHSSVSSNTTTPSQTDSVAAAFFTITHPSANLHVASSSTGFTGEITMSGFAATFPKQINLNAIHDTGTSRLANDLMNGVCLDATLVAGAVDGVKLVVADGGNFSSGTIRLYGVK